jgi:gamma-glutamylcyclotransferase (GGCT)/AIG2-like uncharacterized protein YtfP
VVNEKERGMKFTNKTLIFVYGTLKNGKRLHSILGESCDFITACTTRYKKFDMINFDDNFPIVCFKDDGYKIKGELYSITPETMERINAIEGGAGYIPYIVEVEIPEETKEYRGWWHKAIIYMYPRCNYYIFPNFNKEIKSKKGIKEWK